MYHKRKLKNIKTKDLNFKSPYEWPTYQTTGDNSFFLSLISGIRNAGKSTLVLNIIETEKEHLLRGDSKVYFLSPTKDAKVDYFIEKYPDNFEYIDELTKENVEEVLEKIKGRVEEWKSQKEAYDILDKYLRNPQSLTMDEIGFLEEFAYFTNDKKLEKGKFNFKHPPISSMIIDDSVGNDLICEQRSRHGKWFQKFILRHRHHPYHCNIFILSQHIKSIAKYFRTNCNLVCLFPFRDRSVLKSVFDEYSVLFNGNLQAFLDLMDELRERNQHESLNIYYDKIQFVRIGWNTEVIFEKVEENKNDNLRKKIDKHSTPPQDNKEKCQENTK